MSIYEIEVPTLDGTSTLEEYKGQVLLIVNTASGCGLAPQFAQLQSLYETYHEQGFSVLGFPCNQFGNQEPLSALDAASSCQFNYQVTFPMFGKVLVNGPETHPLFKLLKEETKGLLGSSIKWNFTKFLVDASGEVIARFAPTTSPLSIEKQIKQLLKRSVNMNTEEILSILEDLEVAIFATVDKDGKPHSRPIHIGVANEHGVFFMTSPQTHFYKQLQENQNVAIAAFSHDDYLIQVIRIEGKVREIGKEGLEELLAGNPFVKNVYPDDSQRAGVQVFQLYEGKGFYHSLTQGHKYTFSIQG